MALALFSIEGWIIIIFLYLVSQIGRLIQPVTFLLKGLTFFSGSFTEQDLDALRGGSKGKKKATKTISVPKSTELDQKSIMYCYETLAQQQFKAMSKEQQTAEKLDFKPPTMMSHIGKFQAVFQARKFSSHDYRFLKAEQRNLSTGAAGDAVLFRRE